MAETLTKMIVDCSTGEETIVPLTDVEITELRARQAEMEAEEQARQNAIAQKQADKDAAIAKLTALGLTEAEALALAGN